MRRSCLWKHRGPRCCLCVRRRLVVHSVTWVWAHAWCPGWSCHLLHEDGVCRWSWGALWGTGAPDQKGWTNLLLLPSPESPRGQWVWGCLGAYLDGVQMPHKGAGDTSWCEASEEDAGPEGTRWPWVQGRLPHRRRTSGHPSLATTAHPVPMGLSLQPCRHSWSGSWEIGKTQKITKNLGTDYSEGKLGRIVSRKILKNAKGRCFKL